MGCKDKPWTLELLPPEVVFEEGMEVDAQVSVTHLYDASKSYRYHDGRHPDVALAVASHKNFYAVLQLFYQRLLRGLHSIEAGSRPMNVVLACNYGKDLSVGVAEVMADLLREQGFRVP